MSLEEQIAEAIEGPVARLAGFAETHPTEVEEHDITNAIKKASVAVVGLLRQGPTVTVTHYTDGLQHRTSIWNQETQDGTYALVPLEGGE